MIIIEKAEIFYFIRKVFFYLKIGTSITFLFIRVVKVIKFIKAINLKKIINFINDYLQIKNILQKR